MGLRCCIRLAVLVANAFLLHASVINFESTSDGQAINTQFAGVTFVNAQTLSAGLALNELEYPAHSGKTVVSDNGGPMALKFLPTISTFSGYFTHSKPITIAAFDEAGNQLQVISSTKNNAAVSGDGSASNELLSLGAAGIAKVVITGSPSGGSFVADDLSYSNTSPQISSLVNAASFATTAVGAGSIGAVFGVNLATQTISATSLPLPTSLGGVSATLAGSPTALYYVSPTQINLQLPQDIPAGSATLTITSNGTATSLIVQVAAIAPGVFLIGKYAAAVNLPDGSVNGPTAGVAPGNYVEVFMTGTGTVTPAIPVGIAASGSPLSYVDSSVTASVGGRSASVAFAGLTPGLVDLTQVNIQIPPGLPDGDYPVILTVGGIASNSGLLRVTNP